MDVVDRQWLNSLFLSCDSSLVINSSVHPNWVGRMLNNIPGWFHFNPRHMGFYLFIFGIRIISLSFVASTNFYTCHWHRARITEPYSHPFAGTSGGKTKPLVPSSDDLCSDLSISFRFDWYLESDLTRKKWRRSLMNRKLYSSTKNYNSTLTHSCRCSRAGRCWSMECQSQLQLVRCKPPYEPPLSSVAE